MLTVCYCECYVSRLRAGTQSSKVFYLLEECQAIENASLLAVDLTSDRSIRTKLKKAGKKSKGF